MPKVTTRTCSHKGCENKDHLRKCSACGFAQYCSAEHQVADWSTHKIFCQAFVKRRRQEALDALTKALGIRDDVKAVKEYTRKKLDINGFDSKGFTALMRAVGYSRVKCMKALLQAKAGLQVQHPETGDSALHIAAYANNPECVKLLLKANADCNAVNKDGYTPLHKAASEGCAASVKLLLKAKADCDKASNNGSTPLHAAMAAENCHDACMKLLLDAKANYDATANTGYTPSFMAALRNQRACLKMLIDAKADLEKHEIEYAWTPLMMASAHGHIDCVSELVEAKANIKAVAKNGDTALDIAQEEKHDDICRVDWSIGDGAYQEDQAQEEEENTIPSRVKLLLILNQCI